MAEAKDGLISSFFSLEITGKLVGAFREVTNLGSENAAPKDAADPMAPAADPKK